MSATRSEGEAPAAQAGGPAAKDFDYPIKDVVSRLGDYQLPTAPNAVAQYDANARK